MGSAYYGSILVLHIYPSYIKEVAGFEIIGKLWGD